MGFKLLEDGAFVPCSIKDGVFNIHIGDSVAHIVFPYKSVVFEEQCNFFVMENMQAYLRNSTYKCIVWEDGTASLIQLCDNALLVNFKLDLSPMPLYKQIVVAGSLGFEYPEVWRRAMDNRPYAAMIYAMCFGEGNWPDILYTEAVPLTHVLKNVEANKAARFYFQNKDVKNMEALITVKRQGQALEMSGISSVRVLDTYPYYSSNFIYFKGGV